MVICLIITKEACKKKVINPAGTIARAEKGQVTVFKRLYTDGGWGIDRGIWLDILFDLIAHFFPCHIKVILALQI